MNHRDGTDLTPSASTWSQDRRFKFIDYRLSWDGRIRRTDLTDFFGISLPQASADIAKYQDAAPGNLVYDLSQKSYLRGPEFKAMYSRSSAQAYMSELLALSTGILEPGATFIGWAPPVGVAPVPVRSFHPEILAVLLAAIRDSRCLQVQYQGMSAQAQDRVISPTALAFDGMRWHVRAYCHARQAFRDFVLGRILHAHPGDKTTWNCEADEQWNRVLTIEIGPHPGLSEGARKGIELDFGMVDGKARIDCRQALLYYAIRRLRLEREPDEQQATAQQVVLLNRDELQPYLVQVTTK